MIRPTGAPATGIDPRRTTAGETTRNLKHDPTNEYDIRT
ncbi:hypothetical protein SAMN05444422_10513 [Halobiforma haloterrestris]|uniref:Uncharacterized protein n=1 Tax=Natronobacterium haloterrestre TaxID=148448 RepID=A0A1I1GTF4_NATHA|nr:hypothetical protein SAMN05444422_10513 [Halobiforma haloterrestris]